MIEKTFKPTLGKRIKSKIKSQMKKGIVFNIASLIFFLWALTLAIAIFRGLMISFTNGSLYALEEGGHSFFPSFKYVNMSAMERRGITSPWNFSNYIQAIKSISFDNNTYLSMLFNSLWFSFGSTFMKLVSTICFSYVVSRFKFRGRKFLYGFVIVQMMLPIYGQQAANFKLLSNLGLTDSPLFLLAMGAGHGMFFLICYSFFESLPKSYEEAAMIDGAGYMWTFLRVMLPLAKPIIISIGLLTFISCWNDYSTTLIFLPSHYTLSSGMYIYKETSRTNDFTTTVYLAGIFLSAIPVVALFIMFNKTLMENMSIGGIKG